MMFDVFIIHAEAESAKPRVSAVFRGDPPLRGLRGGVPQAAALFIPDTLPQYR